MASVSSSYLLLTLVLSALVLHSLPAPSAALGAQVGRWTPINDVKDPHVQELGKFAVAEHNKEEKTNLKFDQVVSGESQVVSGKNYRLMVAAEDGGATNKYEAVVWEKAWLGVMNLTSFKEV